MATNKNAAMRYRILDRCFSNRGKRYFYETLQEEVDKTLKDIDSNCKGISRRQIEMDIAFIESREGWNVELDRRTENKKVYFAYSDPNFSINNMPLNDIEINQLQSAVNILSQFKGLPQFEWMQDLLPKLSQGMAINTKQPVIMAFEDNQDLKGREHLGPLYNAILYKEPLLITYKHFYAEQSEDLDIHPYHLKQYNNRWFLFGLNIANKNPAWNMALDRIENIATSSDKFIENETISWEDYFEDVIGVTVPAEAAVENIVLLFTKQAGHYVETKPLHPYQKNYRKEDDTLEVHMKLKINIELERLVLSFGETVKILEPDHLAKKIEDRLSQAASKYR